jgi:hybrid polyketide synthase/nonribosomal peptide synthetase ACE1
MDSPDRGHGRDHKNICKVFLIMTRYYWGNADFHSDIQSEIAVQDVCAEIFSTLPPVAGIANGAMVLVDTAIPDLTPDAWERVLGPKVNGSIYLDKVFSDVDLDFFIFFSSVTAVYGNEGQSNYGGANMFMTGLAHQRRSRGLAASVLHIGPIIGAGYLAREGSRSMLNWVRNHGHCLLSERDFLRGFAEAILTGQPESGRSPEIVLHERLSFAATKVKYHLDDPRYKHVIKKQDDQDETKDGAFTAVPLRAKLLEAIDLDQAYEIIRGKTFPYQQLKYVLIIADALVSKLQVLLQIKPGESESETDEITNRRAHELGLDSLIAVELRTWFLKELDVDIPILRILGDTPIKDLLHFSLERLPGDMIPHITSRVDL